MTKEELEEKEIYECPVCQSFHRVTARCITDVINEEQRSVLKAFMEDTPEHEGPIYLLEDGSFTLTKPNDEPN